MPAGRVREGFASGSGRSASATGINSRVSVQTTSARRSSPCFIASAGRPVTLNDSVIAWPVEFQTVMAPARVSPFMAAIETVLRVPASATRSSGRMKSHGLAAFAVSGGDPFAWAIVPWTAKIRACTSFSGRTVVNASGSGAGSVAIWPDRTSNSCDKRPCSVTSTSDAASAARAASRSVVRRR